MLSPNEPHSFLSPHEALRIIVFPCVFLFERSGNHTKQNTEYLLAAASVTRNLSASPEVEVARLGAQHSPGSGRCQPWGGEPSAEGTGGGTSGSPWAHPGVGRLAFWRHVGGRGQGLRGPRSRTRTPPPTPGSTSPHLLRSRRWIQGPGPAWHVRVNTRVSECAQWACVSTGPAGGDLRVGAISR